MGLADDFERGESMNQLIKFILVGLAGLSFLVASIFIFTLSAGGATLAVGLYGICALCLSSLAALSLLADIRNDIRRMVAQRSFEQSYSSLEDQSAT